MTTRPGFTLLEVSLVLLLLSMLLGFAFPRLPSLTQSALETDGKRLASQIKTMQELALMQGREFRLELNAQESTITALARDPQTLDFHPIKGKNPWHLSAGLRLGRMSSEVTGQSRFGFTPLRFEKLFGETFQIEIDDSGLVDPFEVELVSDNERLLLQNTELVAELRLLGPEAL